MLSKFGEAANEPPLFVYDGDLHLQLTDVQERLWSWTMNMLRFATTILLLVTRDRSVIWVRVVVALLNDAHNEVNARNGRRVYTYAEHCRVYRRPRRLRAAAQLERLGALLLLGAAVALTCRRRGKKLSPRWG